MKQHRALCIEEILEHIFDHLSGFHDRRNHKTLARLARTCSNFYSPAIRVLWRVLPASILPLLRLVPSFRLNKKTFSFDHPVLSHEWDKLFDKARLVHALYYVHDRRIHPSVHEEIERVIHSRGICLFPSLRSLKWSQAQQADKEVLCFTSPSLEHVTVDLYQHDFGIYDHVKADDIADEFCTVPSFLSLLPSVEHLRLSGPFMSPWLREITRFHNLRLLHLGLLTGPTLDLEFLRELSFLERLEEMDLEVTTEPSDDSRLKLSECPDSSGGFSSLRRLVISCSPQALDYVLMLISGPSLQDLSITTRSFALVQEWRSCFSQMGTRFEHSLRRFAIRALPRSYHAVIDETNPDTPTPITTFLQPLLHISTLEELRFDDNGATSSLSDEDVRDLSTHWRNINNIYIWYRRPDPSSPLPTFHSLARLAENCAKLGNLSIELDSRSLPVIAQSPNHGLKTLNLLGNSSINRRDRPKITYILDMLFPHLEDLEVHCYDLSMNNLWKQVVSSLPSVQAAKKATRGSRRPYRGRGRAR